MTYQFKVGDTGKTRGGRKYEIICVTRRSSEGYRVVALLEDQNSLDTVMCYRESGIVHTTGPSPLDLLPPTAIMYWITLYYPHSTDRGDTRTTFYSQPVPKGDRTFIGYEIARGTCEMDHTGKYFNFVVTN